MLAPAKINLFFHLTGKRADGYHLVNSLVAFTSIADRLTIDTAPETQLTIQGDFAKSLAEPKEQNWVLRVLREVEKHCGVAIPLHITLEKNLPVASGIGGGTADGAALLRWIRAHRSHVAPEILFSAAAFMGADGMVCLNSEPAYAEGIGEIVTPVSMPAFFIVLVNPNKPLATRDVFTRFAGAFEKQEPAPHSFTDIAGLVRYLSVRQNQLQGAAALMMPEIQTILDSIENTNGCLLARMSGSGATCFGMYAHAEQAKIAAQYLTQRFAGYWIEHGEAGGIYGA
jgi:4-diphosphocytidyl-2-C-methyl-D-erythritol kinase